MTTEAGVEKTGYRFACSDYKLWMRVIYTNQTAFITGRAADTLERYRAKISALTREEYHAACYRTVEHEVDSPGWDNTALTGCPLDVPVENGNYHFDLFKKSKKGKGLHVKIYENGSPGYSSEEENKLCEAAAKYAPVYDGDAFVFSTEQYSKDVMASKEYSETIHLYTTKDLVYSAGDY